MNTRVPGRLKNDLAHLGALSLWALFAIAVLVCLGMLLSGVATQSLTAEIAAKADEAGKTVPQSYGASAVRFYIGSAISALVALGAWIAAGKIWRKAERKAAALPPVSEDGAPD